MGGSDAQLRWARARVPAGAGNGVDLARTPVVTGAAAAGGAAACPHEPGRPLHRQRQRQRHSGPRRTCSTVGLLTGACTWEELRTVYLAPTLKMNYFPRKCN